MDKLYTINEVAMKLNLSDKTLRRWEEAGRFHPSRTLGNQRRYTLEDLQILDAIKHNTIPDQDDLLTIDQAAKFCGVSPITLGRWENAGKIHPFITSGNTYYPRHKLIEKLEELKKLNLPEPARAYEQPAQPSLTKEKDENPEIEQMAPRLSVLPLPKTSSTLPTFPKLGHNLSLPTSTYTSLLLNLVVTIALLLSYHFLFSASSQQLISPQGQGAVQGVTTTTDPSLDLLKSMMTSTGAFTATSLTSKNGLSSPTLSFSPGMAPTTPQPGTLYYDAESQTLKLYKEGGWSELAGTQTLKIQDGSLITGVATLPRGKNQVTIDNSQVTPSSLVTANFTTDYAPAKKYWITTTQGSFTIHTDFPVSADTPFSYIIVGSLAPSIASGSANLVR